jgi:hypothetical protein
MARTDRDACVFARPRPVSSRTRRLDALMRGVRIVRDAMGGELGSGEGDPVSVCGAAAVSSPGAVGIRVVRRQNPGPETGLT